MKYIKIDDKKKWENLLLIVFALFPLAYNIFVPSNYTGRRLDEEGLHLLLDMRIMSFQGVIYDDRDDSFVAQFNYYNDGVGHIELYDLEFEQEDPFKSIEFDVYNRTSLLYEDNYIGFDLNINTQDTDEIYPTDEYHYFNDSSIYEALGLGNYRYPIRILDVYYPEGRNIIPDYVHEGGRNMFVQSRLKRVQDGSNDDIDEMFTFQMNDSYNIEDLRLFITENNLTSLN